MDKSFDRVQKFLDEFKDLPVSTVNRVREIENDIYTMFNQLEKLRRPPGDEEIDLARTSALVGCCSTKRSKAISALARAAALF